MRFKILFALLPISILIVACNATNDVFSMGATDIVSLQAFLAYPKELPEKIAFHCRRASSSQLCVFDNKWDIDVVPVINPNHF